MTISEDRLRELEGELELWRTWNKDDGAVFAEAMPELIAEIRKMMAWNEALLEANGELHKHHSKAEDKLARVREVLGRSNQGLGQNTVLALTIIEESAGDGVSDE